jgi:hypothetical protein
MRTEIEFLSEMSQRFYRKLEPKNASKTIDITLKALELNPSVKCHEYKIREKVEINIV